MNVDRIEIKHKALTENDYILYIMCSSFRTHNNHSLEHALEWVHMTDKPLVIVLYKEPEDNPRNNQFFQKGITNYQEVLQDVSSNIQYFETVTEDLKQLISSSYHVVKDRGYLKEQRAFEQVVEDVCIDYKNGLSIVESDVFVPVKSASTKEEYAASTIRKKIMSQVEDFTDPIQTTLGWFTGEEDALGILMEFIELKLDHYIDRNDPSKDYTSGLSPYLKYGFISPLTIYNEVVYFDGESTDSFIEELIVRRELAFNFVYYNKGYYLFESMTYPWAYTSMEEHLLDEREYLYTIDDYKACKTHDPYFNAAMKEMIYLGKMHSYMRMYWAKKIIE